MSTQTSWYVLTLLCQCHLELEIVKCPPFSILITSFYQKNSITLQRMQTFSILNQAIVVVGLATCWLPPLQNTPPITMTDLLQVVNCWDLFLTSFQFSLFFFLIPWYIFQICSMFINKVLQGLVIVYHFNIFLLIFHFSFFHSGNKNKNFLKFQHFQRPDDVDLE